MEVRKKCQYLRVKNITYPTVVIVTKAHQKPCQEPLMNEGGKSTGFLWRSCWKKCFIFHTIKQNAGQTTTNLFVGQCHHLIGRKIGLPRDRITKFNSFEPVNLEQYKNQTISRQICVNFGWTTWNAPSTYQYPHKDPGYNRQNEC